MIAVTEQLAEQAEAEGTSLFLTQLFDKQLGRHRQAFDHFIVRLLLKSLKLTFQGDQIKTIDGAKNNIRKRRGVFYFVRHFPLFVERIECQLDGADNLKIRKRVNDAYERVVASVLSSLQYVSKIVAAETSSGDDKGQLYFHVVMIGECQTVLIEPYAFRKPARIRRGGLASRCPCSRGLPEACQGTVRGEHEGVPQDDDAPRLLSPDGESK